MAAVARQHFTGLHLQPRAVHGADAPAVRVQHADLECHVGRHLDAHRAIGLHGRVAHDLPHDVARAKCRTGEIDHILARDRDGLLEPDEAGDALRRRRFRGIGHCGDVRHRGVLAIEVVDALDVQHADALRHQVLVQIDAGNLVENDVRQRARLCGDDVRDHHALDGRHDRQQGVLARIEHPDTIERLGALHSRVREAGIRARHDGRWVLRAVQEPALRPAHQHTVRTVPQGVCGVEPPAGRGSGHGAHVVRRGPGLRRPGQARVGEQRLRVLHVAGAVDDHEVAPEIVVRVRAREREDGPVLSLPRLDELDHRIVRAGVVAVGTVVELHVRTVRIGRVQVHAILAGGVVPAAPQNPAAREDRGVAVVALVEGDLVNVRAVGVHHVQHERGLAAVLVLRLELRLALVQQDRLRLPLPRRGEHDAAVGHDVRRHIVRGCGVWVGGRIHDGVQVVAGDVVGPDAPARRILLLHVHLQGPAHREHHRLSIGRRIDVLHVVGVRSRDAGRDVRLGRARRSAIALEEVRLGDHCLVCRRQHRSAQHPQIVAGRWDRPLHVEDGEIDGGRVRRLAVGDGDVPAATAGRKRSGRGQHRDSENHSACPPPWRGAAHRSQHLHVSLQQITPPAAPHGEANVT